ncbi:MAG: hypothetical protein K6E84_08735 [Lachnospiraceae bacterium]|nr:hypothetical protein [Lachnospiraceae bacterium]
MMEDECLFLKKRFAELADRCLTERRYCYSDFLSLYGLSIFHEMEHELTFAEPEVFGGCDACERRMIRFGSEEICGYSEEYPVRILEVRPAMAKYARKMSHRDFLGSVIGLGLEREKIGDIFVRNNEASIFVHEGVAGYIVGNLEYVGRTKVKVSEISSVPEGLMPVLTERSVLAGSNRIDAVIARLYGLSRDEAAGLVKNGCVFFDGRMISKSSAAILPGRVVSVRGHGRFVFDGEGGRTRKDKIHLNLRVYE